VKKPGVVPPVFEKTGGSSPGFFALTERYYGVHAGAARKAFKIFFSLPPQPPNKKDSKPANGVN